MKLEYRTKPRPHQVRALRRMLKQGGGGLQVPMRYGKSWVAIYWLAGLYHMEGLRRAIILTIPSGLGVWDEQIWLHCPVPYRIITSYGELVHTSKGEDHLDFLVMDYANVYSRMRTGQGAEWIPVANEVPQKFKGQAIVADESHHLGNPTSVQSMYTYMLAKPMAHRLFMTGTMFHRKPFFVFGQMKFYDDGKTLGSSFTQFKKRVAIMGGYGNYEVLGYKNMKWMMDKVKPTVHIEERVPPSPPNINRIKFWLTGKHLDNYLEMETHRVLKVAGETITSEIVLTLHLRLMQIAGGFVKLPSGKYAQVGNCKVEALQGRLEQYMDEGIAKAVVACRFTPELAAIAKTAKKVGFKVILFHGGVPKGQERQKRIRLFHSTKEPTLFISQISTGKEAIDLSPADTMLFYSMTESFVEFDQFRSRIELYGEKRTLQYDFLLAGGTRDEVTYEAMEEKQDVARYLVSNPRKVERITRKQSKRR